MKKLNKRGVLDNLGGLIQTLGYLAILMAVIFLIVANVASNDEVAADTNASVAVDEVQNAMAEKQGLPCFAKIFRDGYLLV